MKWLLVAVAFVLGAVTTWFLTVKRVTRVVSAEDQVPGGADRQAAEGTGSSADVEVDDVEDAAERFRWGSHRHVRRARVPPRHGIATPRTRTRSCRAGRTML